MKDISVVIIGAGVGGISLALDLQQRGINNYTIYELQDGIGGTWYQSTYPGCRCDVAALWYSHSRFLNPNWTETHPLRPELLKYWQDVASSQGVDRHVRLQHRFVSAEWDAARAEYTIVLRNEATGEDVTTIANVLVSAVGGFSTPLYPTIKGQDSFRGKIIHTARWPKDLKPEDLRGKKVAIVGNGCSGVQVLTTLAADPEIEMYAIARSAHWYLPNRHGDRNSAPYSETVKSIYRTFPFIQRLARNLLYLQAETAWPIFPQKNQWIRKGNEKKLRKWMDEKLPKEYNPVAIPDFPMGSKRFVFEDGYFTALNRDNVTPLWGALSGMTEHGFVLDDGRSFDADYVVLSTGFDLDAGMLDIIGSNVKSKDIRARSDLKQYHGIATPGMPNYFTMLGVFSATGHASIAFILEVQANYITQLIEGIRSTGKSLDVKVAATEKWYSETSRKAEKTVWALAESYMRSEGGKGKVWTHFPGFVGQIWWQNRYPEWADYNGAEGLAVRQQARRWTKRAIVLALLVIVASRALPTTWISSAHDAIVSAGVPQSWISNAAGVVNNVSTRLWDAGECVRSLIPWTK